MHTKIGLLAVSAMAALVLLGGPTAEAKEKPTAKSEEKVIVEVASGDTLSSIANAHNTTYVRIFNANDSITNPDTIDVGDEVRIPNKDEKLPNRMAELTAPQQVVATQQAQQYDATIAAPQPAAAPQPVQAPQGGSGGNTYAWGNCTWYVKEKRGDLPNMLGNGGSWSANAAAKGFATGSTPRVGAVAEQAGHVAYVEAVNGNSVTVSEMNYAGGLGQTHTRTVPASTFYSYIY